MVNRPLDPNFYINLAVDAVFSESLEKMVLSGRNIARRAPAAIFLVLPDARDLTGREAGAKAWAMAEQHNIPTANALDGLSFEDALRELETIVQALERGEVPLDDSIALYARGEMLRAQCQKRLADAEARIEQLTVNAAGAPVGTQNFSAD